MSSSLSISTFSRFILSVLYFIFLIVMFHFTFTLLKLITPSFISLKVLSFNSTNYISLLSSPCHPYNAYLPSNLSLSFYLISLSIIIVSYSLITMIISLYSSIVFFYSIIEYLLIVVYHFLTLSFFTFTSSIVTSISHQYSSIVLITILFS